MTASAEHGVRGGRPLISVVLSFRNEAEVIPELISRLDRMFAGQNAQYELLFVNDASTDASLAILISERGYLRSEMGRIHRCRSRSSAVSRSWHGVRSCSLVA